MSRNDQLYHRIEKALREIGSERQLNPAQRNRIRAAMIATARQRAQRRVQHTTSLRALLWPRLIPVGLAFASVLLVAFAAYILAGGATGRPVAQAQSTATFTVFHKRSAPLGIVWHTDQTIQPDTPVVVAEGDILYAPQVVTVTFTDQSVGLIQPDTEVAILATQNGLQLRFGQVDLAVRPIAQAEAGARPRFSVETRRASIAVKGTQFSVHSADDSDTIVTTSGVVEATQRTPTGVIFRSEIRAGEEVSLIDKATAPPAVQLHAPLAEVIEPGGRVIPDGTGTRQTEVILAGRAYPGGVLTIDRPGLLLTTTVDSQGRFTVPVTLPAAEGAHPFYLTIQSPDGRSRTGQLNVVVDKTAPNLALGIPQLSADGARVQLQGQTEPGATVTANGSELLALTDGRFAGEVAMPANRTIRIVARDFAGNVSVLAQTIRP